jgi:hypothetical protein
VSDPLPICPVCLRPGWAAQKPVQWTINRGRVPNFRSQVGGLVDDGDGQLRVYRCGGDLGLWHLTNLTHGRFQMLLAPRFLDLPPAPERIPLYTPVEPGHGYLDQVAADVLLAIHEQERGLAFPHTDVFAARYEVQRSWARGLIKDFARNGLLRKIGALYVTGTTRTDEAPTS